MSRRIDYSAAEDAAIIAAVRYRGTISIRRALSQLVAVWERNHHEPHRTIDGVYTRYIALSRGDASPRREERRAVCEDDDRRRYRDSLALPVATPTWMKPLTRAQLMAGR